MNYTLVPTIEQHYISDLEFKSNIIIRSRYFCDQSAPPLVPFSLTPGPFPWAPPTVIRDFLGQHAPVHISYPVCLQRHMLRPQHLAIFRFVTARPSVVHSLSALGLFGNQHLVPKCSRDTFLMRAVLPHL